LIPAGARELCSSQVVEIAKALYASQIIVFDDGRTPVIVDAGRARRLHGDHQESCAGEGVGIVTSRIA